MFNIKLEPNANLDTKQTKDFRTVILSKNQVEVEGTIKLIVMIRDVTDRVRLEKEQLKKNTEKDTTFKVQQELATVFAKHCEEVELLVQLVAKSDCATANSLALDLKKSNYHLRDDFYQYNDLINIQNDTFSQCLK